MTPRTKRQHITDDHGHYGSTQVVRESKPTRTKLKKFVEPQSSKCLGFQPDDGSFPVSFTFTAGNVGYRDSKNQSVFRLVRQIDWLRTLRHIRRLEKILNRS